MQSNPHHILSMARWAGERQRPLRMALALLLVATLVMGLAFQWSPAIAGASEVGDVDVESVPAEGGHQESDAAGSEDDDPSDPTAPPDVDEEQAEQQDEATGEEAGEEAADEAGEGQEAVEGDEEAAGDKGAEVDQQEQAGFETFDLGGDGFETMSLMGGGSGGTDVRITKTADKAVARVGETINYTITVENKGGKKATNVKVTDPLINLNETVDTLQPNSSVTFERGYVVKSSDLPGPLTNTAKVTGKGTFWGCVLFIFCDWYEASFSETDKVSVKLLPDITLTKEADRESAKPGDTIHYTFTLSNNHDKQLRNVQFRDRKAGYNNWRDFDNGQVGAGATKTDGIDYKVKDSDLPGPFVNEVEVRGEYCRSGTQCNSKSHWVSFTLTATATVPLSDGAEITIEKTADKTKAALGETITYTITVTNTGSVKLTDVRIKDEMLGLDKKLNELRQGESYTVHPSLTKYVVQETDLPGPLTNTATVTAKTKKGTVEHKADWTVDIDYNPAIKVTKTTDKQEYKVGDTVTYTITVKNTGDVTLSNVTVNDPMLGINDLNIGTLAPGQEHTLDTSSTKHVISAGDDNPLSNTVTASGQPPAGDRVEDTATVEVNWQAGNPSLKVYKWANVDKATVGDTITYTIKVQNTGNVPLTNVLIKDEMLGLETTVDSLEPGASHTVDTALTQYVVQEKDLPGPLSNRVDVTAQPPMGEPIAGKATATVHLYALPGLKVTKSADHERATVGDTIQFTIAVKNTGNVTLKNIKVYDPMLGIDGQNIAQLAPGAAAEIQGDYTVKEKDLHQGYLINKASAKVKYGKKEYVAHDTAKVKLYSLRGIELVKEAALADGLESGTVGDTITYTLTVTNTGNVTLKNVTITDDMLEINENIGQLAPGASHKIVREHIITEDDVLRANLWEGDGFLHNTATARGKAGFKTISDSDAAAVPVHFITGLEVTKTAAGNRFRVGDSVIFTVKVTNTGNVPLGWVDLYDDYDPADLELLGIEDENGDAVYFDPELTPPVAWTHPDLKAGESAEYKLTFKVLRNGTIVNEVTAEGFMPSEDPMGDPVRDEAEIRVGSGTSRGGTVPRDTEVQDEEVAEDEQEPLAGADDEDEEVSSVTELEQPAAGPDLPRTGGSVLPYILGGLALMVGGVVLRRRWATMN